MLRIQSHLNLLLPQACWTGSDLIQCDSARLQQANAVAHKRKNKISLAVLMNVNTAANMWLSKAGAQKNTTQSTADGIIPAAKTSAVAGAILPNGLKGISKRITSKAS